MMSTGLFYILGVFLACVLYGTAQDATDSKCDPMADIIFALDSSGSVNRNDAANYKRMLSFTASLTEKFELGPNNVRFGAIIFSRRVMKLFELNEYSDHEDIANVLMRAHYLQDSTNTGFALEIISNGMFDKKNGGRDNATKIVMVMTDGNSNHPARTQHAAWYLKKQGITIMAIGIANANVTELQSMASSPDLVFSVSDFADLHLIHEDVVKETCKQSQPKSKPTV